ncbi:serine--tRNA ligase [bacterium]|nr:serine--tRNA ligase [bacterium]
MYALQDVEGSAHDWVASLSRRGEVVDGEHLVRLDQERRSAQERHDQMAHRAKEAAKRVGKATPEEREHLILRAKEASQGVDKAKGEMDRKKETLKDALFRLPNLPHPDVPLGGQDKGRVVKEWGKASLEERPPHDEIGKSLGILDPEGATHLSGSGWPCLRGDGALLARHLGSWMVEEHLPFGFEEVSPPFVVRTSAMEGSGQLPKFASESYQTEDGDWLIPTSEVALVNLLGTDPLHEEALPIRLTALTPNFRREAGTHGKRNRGLLRQHQFSKVEMVSAVKEGDGEEELLFLVERAESILEKLELPYRRVMLASEDLAFASMKTFDLEVPFPSCGWTEISSVSLCGTFQARRAGIRIERSRALPELLNGTGVAVGRLIAFLLEWGWQENGSVVLPTLLAKRMGKEVLGL